jgi:hypothetical protein
LMGSRAPCAETVEAKAEITSPARARTKKDTAEIPEKERGS